MTDDADQPGPIPPAEGDLDIREPPKILVPVEVLEGETIPPPLVEFLAPADLVVLGYHVLPEQTPTEQASMQFEERVQTAVEDIAGGFEGSPGTLETRVVFTHDRDQTLDRIAAEVEATATLLSNPSGDIVDVLVPIRGAVDDDRLADLVATLADDDAHEVHLWGLGGEAADVSAGVATARETLEARGMPAEHITTEVSDPTGSAIRAIVDRSAAFDVIVVAEGTESLLTAIVGEDEERIADASLAPVLVVRRDPESETPR